MGIFCKPVGMAILLAIGISPICHAQQTWRALDPENTLVIDSTKGRLIIEMRPEMAPKSIDRVKMLARQKIYDGLQFHRVIGNFVAQTGNPNNKTIPRWKPYTMEKRETMVFNIPPHLENDPRGGERKIFAKVPYIQPGS